MVPGDTDDIRKEYDILLNELTTFNPEMLDKQRILAITKSDLLDEELIEMLRPTLPKDVPYVFISSMTNTGIKELKEIIWTELNKESNQLSTSEQYERIVHKSKNLVSLQEELQKLGEDQDFVYIEDEEEEDEDFDYEYEEDWEEESEE